MCQRTETETLPDTWLPVGELFAQIVAGLAPKVLEGVACRMAWEEEEDTRQARSHAGGPRTCDD